MLSRKTFTPLILALLLFALPAAGQIPRIEQDFVQWTQIVIDGNHPEGSDTYVDLDNAGVEEADFRSAVEAFLDEDWALADTRAADVDYEVVEFRDAATGETYYGLLPEADNGDGRGFFFVRPRAQVERRLVIQAAHAVEDKRTGVFGSEIFRASGARALLLSGADRCSSSITSGCSGSTDCGAHRVSDMAHSDETFFQAFHELASAEHTDTLVLQIHGFLADESTEPEFSVSDGTQDDDSNASYLPNAFYRDLQARMANVNPMLTRNGNSCNEPGHDDFKCGTQNTQGRHLNGSTDACGTAASSASGRFVHLEMSNDLREPGGLYEQQLVIDAVNAVFPRTASVGDLLWADVNGNGTRESNERGIHGVTVEVLDLSDVVVETGTSIVGEYTVGNLAAGTYRLRVQLPTGYAYGTGLDQNGRTGTFALSAGQSLTSMDLALVPSSVGQIGDLVWDDADGDGLQDSENGLEGIAVRLLTADEREVDAASSGVQGAFAFDDVLPGDYRLSVAPGANRGLTRQVSGFTGDDSDVDPQTGVSAPFSLAAGVTDTSRDAGLLSPCFAVALVPESSLWRYWTPGVSDTVPSNWNQTGFTGDTGAGTAWQQGLSPLGYGTSRAVTTVQPDTANGIYTTYFRLPFEVGDPAVFQKDLEIELTRDDGVIVYLNGSEIIRRNLPWGFAAGAGTPASTKIDTVETITIPASLLQTGTNVLAVELHQNEEDLSNGLFDLGLTATACGCRVQQDDLPASQGTYIKMGSSTVRGSESTIEMDGGSGAKSGLIQFDLSTLPSGAGILHAELVVHVDDGSGASSDDAYAIHALRRSWDESTAIWTSPWDEDGAVGANDSSPEKLGLMPIDPGTDVEVSAPLNLAGRSVVQGWLDTPATNFGFLLDAEPGSTDGLDLRSEDSATPPRLRVVYTAPSCQ